MNRFIHLPGLWVFAIFSIALGACSGSISSPVAVATGGGGATCASPLPPIAIDSSVTDNIPSDFDATATPTPTPTTTINFTIMLPTRCPGDHFPLVLQSHGYGGTRLKAVGPNGSVDPTQAHFPSINTLVQALPYHGYVVISYDERGHGTPTGQTAPHNARTIDPAAETQDAIAILDWAYDNSETFFIQRESGTGITKDIRVGTIGYSYGGGFEMPLALLDKRVDAMVPNGTWNNLLYSLVPGDAVKLGFDSLLCLLASPTPGVGGNVNNTPLVATLCNLIGPSGPAATSLRTRADLIAAASLPAATPRAARDGDELLNYFYTHSSRYFEIRTRDSRAINPLDKPGYTPSNPSGLTLPGTAARSIPILFLQGNRDSLFNLTDSYFNYEYFKAAGGDVRLLTTEGGHMNPLAQQVEGTANCGGVSGVDSILAWLDMKLKAVGSATYDALPQVCISVTPTPATNSAPTNSQLSAVLLSDIPVGSLSGVGAVPTILSTMTATVASPSGGTPIFVKVADISVTAGSVAPVLAGIPTVDKISVTAGAGATVTPIAYVGVGIKRGSSTILVDEQVTPFANLAPSTGTTACTVATDHCFNRGFSNFSPNNPAAAKNVVMLPGIGEQLMDGDQVGLLFYENQVQYLPANNAGTAAQTGLPNPYSVTLTNVKLPILIPGTYTGSRLSVP